MASTIQYSSKKKSSEESLSLQTTSTYFHDALLLPWYNLWKRHRPILAICVREKKIRQNVVVVFVYITLFWGSAKVRIRAQNIAHCQGSQSNCKSFFLNKQNKSMCVYFSANKFEWRWILRFFDSCIYRNYSSLLVVLVNFLYIKRE